MSSNSSSVQPEDTLDGRELILAPRMELSGGPARSVHSPEDLLDGFNFDQVMRPGDGVCIVDSADTELGGSTEEGGRTRSTIPETMKSMSHPREVFDFIRSPATNSLQIVRRQKIIDGLRTHPRLIEMIPEQDSRWIDMGINNLLEPSQQNNGRRLIDILRNPSADDEDFQLSRAEGAVRTIKNGVDGYKRLIQLLRESSDPFVDKIVYSLESILPELTLLCDVEFLRSDSRAIGMMCQMLGITSQKTGSLLVALQFAQLAERDGYGRATFDRRLPVGYKNGWSFARPKKAVPSRRGEVTDIDQVQNDSPLEFPLTVLSGGNMSGKSFQLKMLFYMQLLAQSFGHVPCEGGNFDIHDSFHYLDRSSTDSSQNLSAFGMEMMDWMKSIQQFGRKPYICCDEGGSTTSPDDQYCLLRGIDLYLRQQGARFFLATHNEEFIQQSRGEASVGMYHLETHCDAKGDMQYTHLLRPGHGDAMALDVGRSLGLSEEIIAMAKLYLQGMVPPLDPSRIRSHRAFPQRNTNSMGTALDRVGSAGIVSIHRLIPSSSDVHSVLRVLSLDPDFEVPNTERRDAKLDTPIVTGYYHWQDGHKETYPHEDMAERRNAHIHQLLAYSYPGSPEELLDRQDMFAELMEKDELDMVHDMEIRFLDTMNCIDGVYRRCYELTRFNLKLYPHKPTSGRHIFPERFQRFLDFYELNEKIFGDQFPLKDELAELRELMKCKEEHETTFTQMDISQYIEPPVVESIQKILDKIRTGYDEDGVYAQSNVITLDRLRAIRNTIRDQSAHPRSHVSGETIERLGELIQYITHVGYNTPLDHRQSHKQYEDRIYELLTRLDTLHHKIPAQSLLDPNLDIDAIRPFVMKLIDDPLAAYRHHNNFSAQEGLGGQLTLSHDLSILFHENDAITDYLDMLRGHKSVLLHQLANGLEHAAKTTFKPGPPCSGKKLIAAMREHYLHGIEGKHVDLVKLEDEMHELASMGGCEFIMPWYSPSFVTNYNHVRDSIGHNRKNDRESSGRTAFARWFMAEKYPGGSAKTKGYVFSIEGRTAEGGFRDRDFETFYAQEVVPSPEILARFHEIGKRLNEIGASKLDSMRSDVSTRMEKNLEKNVGAVDYHTKHYAEEGVATGLSKISALFCAARMMREQGFSAVQFNETGKIHLENAWSMLKRKGDQVPCDISFGDRETEKILSGPNMSGKTFFLKKTAMALAWAMATGFAPAESATMPFIDRVHYLDRVLVKNSKKLSAYGNEVSYWNHILQDITQHDGRMTVSLFDEIGSTTSTGYQAALASAILTFISNHGGLSVAASHHHELIDRLTKAHKGVAVPYSFAGHVDIDADGKGGVAYTSDYILEQKHGMSRALEVARKLGFPEEILQMAELIAAGRRS